jgi:hypothetical protein
MSRAISCLGRALRPAAFPGRALCLAALLIALAACAPKVELPRYEDAETNLSVFRARFLAHGPETHGLAVRSTLLYNTPKRSNRTDVQLFGEYALPLRLDVRAGLGTMLALMREDAGGLLAFYPDRQKAYAHSDPVIGAQLLGLPFPFALKDLALVLSGSFSSLIPPEPASLQERPGGGFVLRYASGPVRLLALDPHGRPERMEGQLSPHFRTQAEREGEPVSGPRTWAIAFSDYPEDEAEPEGPATVLTLTLPKGESAVLRVRALAQHPEPWPARALTLTLPAQAKYVSLERPAASTTAPAEVITGGGANEPGAKNPGGQPEAKPRP